MLIAEAASEARTYFDELRDREFSRLDAQHLAYLDYTGSALYGESQLRAHHALMQSSVFGNPHSDSDPSRASSIVIDDARRKLLRFLDADESTYDVIFTANASAAIKLVAESYAFERDSLLLLSTDNHNSINGIREYAKRAGAEVRSAASQYHHPRVAHPRARKQIDGLGDQLIVERVVHLGTIQRHREHAAHKDVREIKID